MSFDFSLTRNHGPKLQNLKNFPNFEPEYLLWPSLARRLLWFFRKSLGSTFIPWKKFDIRIDGFLGFFKHYTLTH